MPAVERRRMLTGGANSPTACVGAWHQRAAPVRRHHHAQTRSILELRFPRRLAARAEPRHAALASSCLIPRCEEMLHLLFLVIRLGRGTEVLK